MSMPPKAPDSAAPMKNYAVAGIQPARSEVLDDPIVHFDPRVGAEPICDRDPDAHLGRAEAGRAIVVADPQGEVRSAQGCQPGLAGPPV